VHPHEEDAMKRWIIGAALVVATVAGGLVGATADASTDRLQVVRLECAVRAADAVDAEPVVHCRWSEPRVPPAAAVRLWRVVDPGSGSAREVVYRSDDLEVQEFTDVMVRRGHVYLYAVQLLDENGRIVGRSRVEVVRIPAAPPGVEVIELECELAIGGAHVHCRWTAPTAAGAEKVALWRSVDGQGRELVASFRPDGPTAYRDPVPPGASRLVYAVIVTNANGRIVGRSRPEKVAVPQDRPTTDTRPVDTQAPDTRPPDIRPADTRPPDTRPADTRPPDTRPADTRPVDTRPTDTRPTDTRPVTVSTVAEERDPGERGGP
jgi:hypothetical protein